MTSKEMKIVVVILNNNIRHTMVTRESRPRPLLLLELFESLTFLTGGGIY